MRTNDFDYPLPQELIAQHPIKQRDASRLMILERIGKTISHRHFADLEALLLPGDVLVMNNSRVIPARVRGRKEGKGARIEILLTEEHAPGEWWCMLRPGKRIHNGTRIQLNDLEGNPTDHWFVAINKNETGKYLLRSPIKQNIFGIIAEIGETPLPPYINRKPVDTLFDRERYQTVYAKQEGSVAAPTAGLHFTKHLLTRLQSNGVQLTEVTLHVGPGTFQPVECNRIEDHPMHEENFSISDDAASIINRAKDEGRRVIAVGTTSMRVLESVGYGGMPIKPQIGRTDIFIFPPHEFQVVDALVTNFHLPKSTLLMLVSAFAQPGGTEGYKYVLQAYTQAVEERYRFFSYGDSMLLC